jgi:heme exporter protein CcmD
MADFFAMGGYAWYVWMAYGVAAMAIAIEIAAVRGRRKRAFDELRMSVDVPPARASTTHKGTAR